MTDLVSVKFIHLVKFRRKECKLTELVSPAKAPLNCNSRKTPCPNPRACTRAAGSLLGPLGPDDEGPAIGGLGPTGSELDACEE
jgi:hypothetical protein